MELGEWTAYLDTYGLQLGGERAAYLYTVIQSHNAEMKEGGSSHNGQSVDIV